MYFTILVPILYSISVYDKEEIGYYIIYIICLIIMGFCSLVYNEFLVLYFCGSEKNIYLEITKSRNHYQNLHLASKETIFLMTMMMIITTMMTTVMKQKYETISINDII